MSGISTASVVTQLGQQQLEVFADIGRMVSSTLDRQAQNARTQADITQGMITSVLNEEKMRQDNNIRMKGLELEAKSLSLREKQFDIGLKEFEIEQINKDRQLDIQQKQADAQIQYYQNQSDRYKNENQHKPYIDARAREASNLKYEYDRELRVLDDKITEHTTSIFGNEKSGIKPMSTAQRLLDKKNPLGKIATLEKLSKERDGKVKSFSERDSALRAEIANVAAGGSPGQILPLPKATESTTNTTNNSTTNPLLPDVERLPPVQLEAEDDSWDDNQQAEPDDDAQSDIVDETSKELPPSVNDQEIIGSIYADSTPLSDVRELISLLSPEGKKQIDNRKQVLETAFLRTFGSSKNYKYDTKSDGNDIDGEKGFYADIINKYTRVGGDPVNIRLLEAEAYDKLLEFQVEADDKVVAEENFSTSDTSSYVAKKYNEWVGSRLKQTTSAQEQDKQEAIKQAGNVDSKLKYVSSSNDVVDVNNFTYAGDNSVQKSSEQIKFKEKTDELDKDLKDFTSTYLYDGGENGKQLKKNFITFLEENLSVVDMPISSADVTYSASPEELKQQKNKKITDIIRGDRTTQFNIWRELKNKKKK